MKYVFKNQSNTNFRATQPKKYARATIRYLEKTETQRRNQIRKEKRGE